MYEAKKFNSIQELNGISERTMAEHYKLYEGYVKKWNEIVGKLQEANLETANQIYSDFRGLSVEMTFALAGIKNHEVYFSHLGGDGGEPSGQLGDQITKDFGSFEQFKKIMTAAGLSARGWAWLIYDHDLKRLLVTVGDSQNTYVAWNAIPLLALDVYEHAYYIDYGTKRADYITTFFSNIDWSVVEQRFEEAVK
jgi:Fe-Mn family superoxide dismutase